VNGAIRWRNAVPGSIGRKALEGGGRRAEGGGEGAEGGDGRLSPDMLAWMLLAGWRRGARWAVGLQCFAWAQSQPGGGIEDTLASAQKRVPPRHSRGGRESGTNAAQPDRPGEADGPGWCDGTGFRAAVTQHTPGAKRRSLAAPPHPSVLSREEKLHSVPVCGVEAINRPNRDASCSPR
jgi:hypothetical protein